MQFRLKVNWIATRWVTSLAGASQREAAELQGCLVMINRLAWKALIEREFGDGITSTIDFDMDTERQPRAMGERVK